MKKSAKKKATKKIWERAKKKKTPKLHEGLKPAGDFRGFCDTSGKVRVYVADVRTEDEFQQLADWEERANIQSLGLTYIEVFEELGPFFSKPVSLREPLGTHKGSTSYIEAVEQAAAAQGIQKVRAMGSITGLMTDPILSGKEAFDIVLERAVEGLPIRLLGAFSFRDNAAPLIKVRTAPRFENHLGHVSVWIGNMDRERLIKHILETWTNDGPRPSKFEKKSG